MVDQSKLRGPERLDRLIEVMHHFNCREPGEMDELLALPADSLSKVFRDKSAELPEEVEKALAKAGVSKTYLRDGDGSMLEDAVDGERLSVMARHAAHLLRVICDSRFALEEAGTRLRLPRQVTDGRQRPTALEEELINLLIEVLNDPAARDRLLKFIRKEAENRRLTGPRTLI